jgi:hypothetical protein
MTDEFKEAWGYNNNGGFDSKVSADGTSLTIYQAWCKMTGDTNYLSNWTTLESKIATAAEYVDYYETNVKPDMDNYWEDKWIKSDGTSITASDRCTANSCWLLSGSCSGTPRASQIYVTENSYSNMPWYWRYGLGKSTNDWYKFILFTENKPKCQTMHEIDTYLKTCKANFEAIMGAGTSNIEVRDIVKDDYSDFTAPTWWGELIIIGQQSSVATANHPTTNTTSPTCGTYARYFWCWKLPDKSSDTLKDMLLWFLFDYTGTDGYGNGHHGNTWASIWLQYATIKCGGSITGNENAGWVLSSVLCGTETTTTTNAALKGGRTQLLATFPNAYRAMLYYDRDAGVECLYWYYQADTIATFNGTNLGKWLDTNDSHLIR